MFSQELRDAFVFKIVPMLNPDGVIVGNYRCSLAARDLNRNYRHPRKTSFPTIWHTKMLMEEFSQKHEVGVRHGEQVCKRKVFPDLPSLPIKRKIFRFLGIFFLNLQPFRFILKFF